MATTYSLTSTYAGQAAKDYIAATLLASKTIDNVEQHLNIAYKEVIRKYAGGASFANETCEFTPTGEVAITEISLTPKRIQWQQQFCKKDFIQDWDSAMMGASYNGQTLPATFEAFTLQRMVAIAADYIEQIIWDGTAATAGEFDGFLAQIGTADLTGVAITSGNVIATLTAVVNALPTAVLSQRSVDLNLYVPTSVIWFYQLAQSALGASDMFYERTATPMFMGIPLIECPGLANNNIVAARKSNLLFGTSIIADFNEVALIDMEAVNLDKTVRFGMTVGGDTAIGFRTEIIYWTLA